MTFWATFIRAVEAEPQDIQSVQGKSGLIHPTIAIGVDQIRKRLVVISGDPDGRSAALSQADVQAAYSDYRVIVARPIAVNLSTLARGLASLLGTDVIRKKDLDRLSRMSKRSQRALERHARLLGEAGFLPAIQALGYAALNAIAAWNDVFTQLSHVEFHFASSTTEESSVETAKKVDSPLIGFGSLIAFDPAETDRRMGVCSVPLYEILDHEAEVFNAGSDIETAREILKSHDILQYFFPSPDQLALGVIEKEQVSRPAIVDWLRRPPEIGHPFGPAELIPPNVTLDQLVDMLQERKLVVEGEIGLELSDEGMATRATVKFKPREGLLAKLSQIIKVNLDLAELLRPKP